MPGRARMTREPSVRIGFGAAVCLLLVAAVALGGTEAPPGPWLDVAREVSGVLDRAVRAYEASDPASAQDLAGEAYFGAFEDRGMEAAIRREISARRSRDLEKMFAEIRQAMGRGEPVPRIRQRIATLREALDHHPPQPLPAAATA